MSVRLAGILAPFTLAAGAVGQYVPTVLAADRVSGRIYMLLSGPQRVLRVHVEDARIAAPEGMYLEEGRLEVVSVSGASGVTTFQPESGAVIGRIVPPGSGGLVIPDDVGSTFRQRGLIFVLDALDGTVRRYVADTGLFISAAVAPHAEASAMVVSRSVYPFEFHITIAYPGLNQVWRYDGNTGRFQHIVVPNIARPRAMWAVDKDSLLIAEDNADPQTPDRVLFHDGGLLRPVVTLAPGETAMAIGQDWQGHSYISVGERIDQYDSSWTLLGSWRAPGAEFTAFVPCNNVACYADCDTAEPRHGPLDVFDFLCFQNKYSNGLPYACNCDIDTGMDVCDVFDYLCFQNAYAAGCP